MDESTDTDVVPVISNHVSPEESESESEEWIGLNKINPESRDANSLLLINIARNDEAYGPVKIPYIVTQFQKHLLDLIWENRLTGEVKFQYHCRTYVDVIKLKRNNVQILACSQDEPEKYDSMKSLLKETLQMPIFSKGLIIVLY